jgi:hypothetical protein
MISFTAISIRYNGRYLDGVSQQVLPSLRQTMWLPLGNKWRRNGRILNQIKGKCEQTIPYEGVTEKGEKKKEKIIEVVWITVEDWITVK